LYLPIPSNLDAGEIGWSWFHSAVIKDIDNSYQQKISAKKPPF
tara:strand:+ start:489 stop:617 length:129 start_codon:yes stop_codon:yes gene_type:complete